MHRRFSLSLAIGSLGLLLALSMPRSHAFAESPNMSPAQARLLTAMAHRHHLPSAETLRQLEHELDVEAALHHFLLHPKTAPLLRARTLLVLRHYPSDATRDAIATFIRQLQAEPTPDLLHLGRALRLVGHTLGPNHPEWALDQLEPFAAHADVGIREVVLKALLTLRTQPALQARADAILLQRNLAERTPHLRRLLNAALTTQPLRLPHDPVRIQQP